MKEEDKLWEKVNKDFPYDPALREVHYARLRIHEQTKGMTSKEFVSYIKRKAKKVLEKNT
ncbi:MAG: hypothetical protein AB1630_05795 [bacterium]